MNCQTLSPSAPVLSLTQLHIAISKTSARVLIDCKAVAEKNIKAAGNITIDGVEVLGRMVRSRGNKDNSAPVRIACTNTSHTRELSDKVT